MHGQKDDYPPTTKGAFHKNGHWGRLKWRHVAAKCFWWPHLNRHIQIIAGNWKECLNSGKNLKSVTPYTEKTSIDLMEESNHKIQLGFTGLNYGELVSIY